MGLKRILLIEDNNSIYDELEYLLRLCGYEVLGCTTFNAGFDRLVREEKVDVVVCDLWIGRHLASDFINMIRSNKKLKSLKIILYSGEDRLPLFAEKYHVSAVRKPLANELLNELERLTA